jgi:hypothetical protein
MDTQNQDNNDKKGHYARKDVTPDIFIEYKESKSGI